jgi:hypothetical protein
MKKRFRITALCLLFCLMLTACKDDKGNGSTPGTGTTPGNGTAKQMGASTETRVFFDPFSFDMTMSESFAFVPAYGDTGAQYFDTASRTEILFCFEPNCEHKAPRYDNLTGEMTGSHCAAKSLRGRAYYLTADAGYFFSWPNLVKTDRQGLNQKTIATVEEPIDFIEYEIYTDKYYAATAMISYEHTKVNNSDGSVTWMQGAPLEKEVAGILLVSLTDGSSKLIFRDDEHYDALTTDLYEYQNHLYFVETYLDVPFSSLPQVSDDTDNWEEIELERRPHFTMELYDYDLATGKLTMVHRSAGEGYGFRFGDGFILQYRDSITGEGSMLYRLNGDVWTGLPWEVSDRVMTDGTPIFSSYESGVTTYRMYDPDKKELLHEIAVSDGKFRLSVAAGNSYYGSVSVSWSNGLQPAYITAEDFWNGNFDGAVILHEPQE